MDACGVRSCDCCQPHDRDWLLNYERPRAAYLVLTSKRGRRQDSRHAPCATRIAESLDLWQQHWSRLPMRIAIALCDWPAGRSTRRRLRTRCGTRAGAVNSSDASGFFPSCGKDQRHKCNAFAMLSPVVSPVRRSELLRHSRRCWGQRRNLL